MDINDNNKPLNHAVSFFLIILGLILVIFMGLTYVTVSNLETRVNTILAVASSTQAIASSTQPIIGVGAQASVNIWDLIVEQSQTKTLK